MSSFAKIHHEKNLRVININKTKYRPSSESLSDGRNGGMTNATPLCEQLSTEVQEIKKLYGSGIPRPTIENLFGTSTVLIKAGNFRCRYCSQYPLNGI